MATTLEGQEKEMASALEGEEKEMATTLEGEEKEMETTGEEKEMETTGEEKERETTGEEKERETTGEEKERETTLECEGKKMENTLVSRIVEAFADDLFRYLLPRRINVVDCRVREKWDSVPRVFHPHFGMSVLCEGYRRQKAFYTYYAEMFPTYVESLEAYITFCARYADALSEHVKNDVFKSMQVVAAMILELGVFCHLKGYKNYKYYSTICFGEFFKIFMKQICPTGYDWGKLKTLSEHDAKFYKDGKFEVLLDHNQVEYRNEWLRTFDAWASTFDKIYLVPQTFIYYAPAAESGPNVQETTNVGEATNFHEGTNAQEATNSQEGTNVPEANNSQEWTNVPEATNSQEGTNIQEATNFPEGTNIKEAAHFQEGTNIQEWTNVKEVTNFQEGTNIPEATNFQGTNLEETNFFREGTNVQESNNFQVATNVQEPSQEAIFAKPADVSVLQKKANKEKKVSIVNTTSEVSKKYKTIPKKLKLENEYVPQVPMIDDELLGKFRHRVNSEQDSASRELAEMLKSNVKTNILMNDETFLQVITQKTSRKSRKKMKTEDILELAKLVLGGNDHLARVLVRTVHYIGRAKKAKEAAKKDETVEADKAPEAARPWQETGAIPKFKKDSAKSDDRPPRKIYSRLAQEFRITVSAENDSAGEQLCELFNSPISSDILLSDEVFREVMQLTVNYPTNKWGNDWLLSTAKSLIEYDLSVGQQPPTTANNPKQPPLKSEGLRDELLSRLYNLVLSGAPVKGIPIKPKDSTSTDKSKATLSVKFNLL